MTVSSMHSLASLSHETRKSQAEIADAAAELQKKGEDLNDEDRKQLDLKLASISYLKEVQSRVQRLI